VLKRVFPNPSKPAIALRAKPRAISRMTSYNTQIYLILIFGSISNLRVVLGFSRQTAFQTVKRQQPSVKVNTTTTKGTRSVLIEV